MGEEIGKTESPNKPKFKPAAIEYFRRIEAGEIPDPMDKLGDSEILNGVTDNTNPQSTEPKTQNGVKPDDIQAKNYEEGVTKTL